MNNSMDILINRIISLLQEFRTSYPEHINAITNDLINYKFDSLNDFLDIYCKNINYSSDIKELVIYAVENKLLDESYLEKIKDNKPFEFIPLKETSILKINSRPLNVKENVLNNIENNAPTPDYIHINQEYMEIKFDNDELKTETNIIDESPTFIFNNNDEKAIKDNEQTHEDINSLRNKIIEAQLNYLNNASSFIQNLEKENEIDIYNSLIDLNDIRFIQHSLSKLSTDTLERLLDFVQNKLELNKHNSIDLFIIEVIKKYLHPKMH